MINTSQEFIDWLRKNENELMEKILVYAKRNDYIKYTSTLIEAWRISIVGLTDSLELLMQAYSEPPSIGPDESFHDDPASQFGILEANRHRNRGVNYAMFVSLFKYYKRTYHDLIEENQQLFVNRSFFDNYIESFFDRVEIAYSIEWHGSKAEDQIHELSKQNRALANEKNLYLTIFDSFDTAAILLNSKGDILNYNVMASKLIVGYAQRSGTYYYDYDKKIKTPQWLKDVVQKNEKKFSYTFSKDNLKIIYDGSLATMNDISGKFSGYIITLNDVTQLHEKDLRIHQLATILENANVEVYIFNKISKNFVYVNERGLENTGFDLSEFKKITLSQLQKISEAEYASHLLNLEQNNMFDFEAFQYRKDGTSYPVSVTLQTSYYNGHDVYVAIVTDMSIYYTMQQEVKNAQELMLAQSKHAAMGEMISMIAHQWRQPIAAISMIANNFLLDISLENVDLVEFETMANDINENTQELSKTIDDFRNFFKPNKAKEVTKIDSIMQDTFSIIGKSLENNNITLKLHINQMLKEINTYPRELMQVFINIINNAKDVLLDRKIENPTILINCEESNNEKIIIKICDNGGGIKENIIDKIFDPYFSTKNEKNGTGLGLYMSKMIIEKHLFGTINVLNDNNGVCFKIELPYILKKDMA